MDIQRLFFCMEVAAPWPETFPSGRILLEKDRHLTLAFLGDTDWSELQPLLSTFPVPTFPIGLAGYFDRPLFLPHRAPRVAAWRVQWFDGAALFSPFHRAVIGWLQNSRIPFVQKGAHFLPHVTMARAPFSIRAWKQAFQKLPLFTRNIQLCHSLGHSQYEVFWEMPILPPFEEIEHTADMAFVVRGQNFPQLFLHAFLSLSFYFPPLLNYFSSSSDLLSLDAVITALNHAIARADQEGGTPFKAVSAHGVLQTTHILTWEMIVDV